MYCYGIYTTHTNTHTLTTGLFDHSEVNKIMEESVKMKHFNHPNVMNLIGVCIDAGPAPYIIMPFMANGSLLLYLRKERPNLLLNDTTDDDLVRICLILQPSHKLYITLKVSASKMTFQNILYFNPLSKSHTHIIIELMGVVW